MNHAPTPWVLGGSSGRMITTSYVYSGDGFIADVDTLANSIFIIKAVNNHYKLLEVVKEALKDIRSTRESADAGYYPKQDIEIKLENIIKQYETEEGIIK